MPDWRRLEEGRVIPTQGYCDQPYVAVADDGAWVCTMTTGSGVEGEPGQHIEILRSTDQGRTWPFRVAIEPANGPEASYSVLLKVPGGRLFCFYNHNTDNTRRVLCDPGHAKKWEERVDSQGHFVFKYSDDHGVTWSDRRYEIPQRDFEIDRENPYQGRIKYFWNVGRAFLHQGKCCVPIHKVGGFGYGFFTRSEGALLVSEDLAEQVDPSKAAGGRGGPARPGGRGQDRGGAEFFRAERQFPVLRVPHGRRPPRPDLQPRRRQDLRSAALPVLRGRTPDAPPPR
ncbi:MAG TPA: sialidase family protein, partial [Clostridia bacterium]|nr:sialidase family protein [Clostridia bacterium]